MSELYISSGLRGKMENMVVITASCLENEFCKKSKQDPLSICSKCYAQRSLSYMKNARDTYAENGRILSQSVIPFSELPKLNVLFCRFESHGDLINLTHLQNYINIAKKNPRVRFTIWTKRIDIVKQYFEAGGEVVENFKWIFSSVLINQGMIKPIIEMIKSWGIDYQIFTVYTKEFAEANKISINCGDRKCFDCLKCYSKTQSEEDRNINELLK